MYDYFRPHESEFPAPAGVELAMLRLAPEQPELENTVADIERTLKTSPERFSELVRRYSVGSGVPDGVLGLIELRKLRPEFAAALKDVEVNRIYGPIRVGDGVVWLRVLAYHPAREAKFEELNVPIRQRLETEQRNRTLRVYANELREKAIINYFF